MESEDYESDEEGLEAYKPSWSDDREENTMILVSNNNNDESTMRNMSSSDFKLAHLSERGQRPNFLLPPLA